MKNLHPLAFAALTLPLILAACGTAATPTAAAPANAKLVKLALHAPVGAFRAQGLPTGVSAMHFNVHVRDSNNKLLAFKDGAYDPSGQGSTTLSLNSGNAFAQTVLLPEGSYTFENSVKDDLTDRALLAYGPATENEATVSSEAGVVMLKFHAVYDPTSSSLDFGTNVPHLMTNMTFNLGLFAKSSPVDGVSASIPTSDLGPVSYSIGGTDGTLNSVGSKLGVNVTAGGTLDDTVMDVQASFSAWVRDGDNDTAAFVPTTLAFSKTIEMEVPLKADAVMPVANLNAVADTYVGASFDLSGMATDDVMVGSIKLYDNMNLVASSDERDGVPMLYSNGDGSWNASWTPSTKGSHELTLAVTDSSGNESRSSQTVQAGVQNYDRQLNYADNGGYSDSEYYTLGAHSDTWVKVNTNGYVGYNYFRFFLYGSSLNGLSATYGITMTDQMPMNGYDYSWWGYSIFDRSEYINSTVFYMHLKNDNDYAINVDVYANNNND